MRSVGEQHVEGVVETVEPGDDGRPLTILDETGSAEVADLAARDTHGDVDPGAAPLEGFRAPRPGLSEVEVVRSIARFGTLARTDDARHAIHAFLSPPLCEQIPDAGLEDEPVWVETPRDDGSSLAVADIEPVSAPERAGDHGQVRNAILFAKPAPGIDMEEPCGAVGALLQFFGKRCQELQLRRREFPAEAELGGRPDEQCLGFGRVQPRQLRAIAALQSVAACRAANGDDGHASCSQSLRVALHRSLGDLEALGELRHGQVTTRLQDEQEGDETAGTHGVRLFEKHDRRWRDCAVVSPPTTEGRRTVGVRPIPEGYHSVTPYLTLGDAAGAIEFYKRAFGAKERMRMNAPDGRIGHAELEIGDSLVMLADAFPQSTTRPPSELGGTTGGVFLYVEDVDAVVQRAVDEGATVTMEVADQFWGDRFGSIADPFGHSWSLATHVEDVPPEEMAERSKAAMAAMAG